MNRRRQRMTERDPAAVDADPIKCRRWDLASRLWRRLQCVAACKNEETHEGRKVAQRVPQFVRVSSPIRTKASRKADSPLEAELPRRRYSWRARGGEVRPPPRFETVHTSREVDRTTCLGRADPVDPAAVQSRPGGERPCRRRQQDGQPPRVLGVNCDEPAPRILGR